MSRSVWHDARAPVGDCVTKRSEKYHAATLSLSARVSAQRRAGRLRDLRGGCAYRDVAVGSDREGEDHRGIPSTNPSDIDRVEHTQPVGALNLTGEVTYGPAETCAVAGRA